MGTTRVVWARSVALPDRLLVQARAGELVDLGESCLWQRGARSVRSGVVGWSSLAGGPWVAASCSIYLATRSTSVSICLTLGGRQLLYLSIYSIYQCIYCLSDLGRPPAARGERAERGARAGALVREPSLPGRRVARVAPRVPDQACSAYERGSTLTLTLTLTRVRVRVRVHGFG